jgi:hypothetical protein
VPSGLKASAGRPRRPGRGGAGARSAARDRRPDPSSFVGHDRRSSCRTLYGAGSSLTTRVSNRPRAGPVDAFWRATGALCPGGEGRGQPVADRTALVLAPFWVTARAVRRVNRGRLSPPALHPLAFLLGQVLEGLPVEFQRLDLRRRCPFRLARCSLAQGPLLRCGANSASDDAPGTPRQPGRVSGATVHGGVHRGGAKAWRRLLPGCLPRCTRRAPRVCTLLGGPSGGAGMGLGRVLRVDSGPARFLRDGKGEQASAACDATHIGGRSPAGVTL